MHYARLLFIGGALAVLVSIMHTPAWPQGLGGGAIVGIDDGTAHECIDTSKYNVSIQLVGLQVRRTSNFWSRSKNLGAKIDVTILNKNNQEFVFPRGVLINAREINGDIATLPIKKSIMSKYRLDDGTDPYVNIGLNIFVINLEEQTPASSALLQFIDFSSSLPLPPNPYVQGVQHFAGFAQKVIEANIRTAEEKSPVAALSFDLASNDDDLQNCPRGALRQGVTAVIFSHQGSESDGIIPLSELRNFCLELSEDTNQILYRRKSNDGCVRTTPPKILRNPLVAILVNKWLKDPRGQTARSIIESATRQAVPNAPTTVTTSAATIAASKLATNFADANTSAEGIKDLFGFFINQPLRPLDGSGGQVREAEAAVSLRLCAIAGVPANECD